MNTKENTKDKPRSGYISSESHFLVLHNDEVNTFDFVIDSLVDVCRHNVEQAEQCAYITHHKGKCDVKKGDYDVLVPMKEKLISKGLSITID